MAAVSMRYCYEHGYWQAGKCKAEKHPKWAANMVSCAMEELRATPLWLSHAMTPFFK